MLRRVPLSRLKASGAGGAPMASHLCVHSPLATSPNGWGRKTCGPGGVRARAGLARNSLWSRGVPSGTGALWVYLGVPSLAMCSRFQNLLDFIANPPPLSGCQHGSRSAPRACRAGARAWPCRGFSLHARTPVLTTLNWPSSNLACPADDLLCGPSSCLPQLKLLELVCCTCAGCDFPGRRPPYFFRAVTNARSRMCACACAYAVFFARVSVPVLAPSERRLVLCRVPALLCRVCSARSRIFALPTAGAVVVWGSAVGGLLLLAGSRFGGA